MRYLGLILTLSLVALAQEPGTGVYDKYCSQCHGDSGAGDGDAAPHVTPRPRDFTSGVFKFRTTPSGSLPTDDDLKTVIRNGIPGTSMPDFSNLTETEIDGVIAHIKTFFQDTLERDREEGFYPPKVIEVGPQPKIDQVMRDRGRKLYLQNGCIDCHGFEGRADGPSASTLKTDDGQPIAAANLTRGWEFRGGHGVDDIFTAFSTGLSGTPMASFADSIKREDRWALAAYVASLATDSEPSPSPQVVAAFSPELPQDMDSDLWANAKSAYFPLTGQMTWPPINEDPSIRSVQVRALHDGQSLTLLLQWDDASFSFPVDEQEPTTSEEPVSEADAFFAEEDEGDTFDDFFGEEEPAETIEITPDQFAIQFPSGVPATSGRPYFIMGDGKNPVNLVRWVNDGSLQPLSPPDTVDPSLHKAYTLYRGPVKLANQLARGRDDISDLADATPVEAQLEYRNGRYSLMVTRGLQGESDQEIQFEPGTFVPIAFWGWDGHRGEQGVNASLSAWYFIRLEQKVDMMVYAKTGLAIVLSVLLLLWAARQSARQRKPTDHELEAEVA